MPHGRAPCPHALAFGSAAQTDTGAAAAAPRRHRCRVIGQAGGRGGAVQKCSLSDAVLGARPRSARAVEVAVGYDDVVASHVSEVRLELLHLHRAVV